MNKERIKGRTFVYVASSFCKLRKKRKKGKILFLQKKKEERKKEYQSHTNPRVGLREDVTRTT